MNAEIIEYVVAEHFRWEEQNLIIPNVRSGLEIPFEVDLLILTKANYLYDIEIKISAADLKKEWEKEKFKRPHKKHFYDKMFKRHYFAIPAELYEHRFEIPEMYGILTIQKDLDGTYSVKERREAIDNKDAPKMSDDVRMKLGYLSYLRMWNCKRSIYLRLIQEDAYQKYEKNNRALQTENKQLEENKKKIRFLAGMALNDNEYDDETQALLSRIIELTNK